MGPGFELVEPLEDFVHGLEAGVKHVCFAWGDAGFGDVAEVDDAEVDAADWGFIVVDQADDGFVVGGVDGDFFGELALHAGAVDVVGVEGVVAGAAFAGVVRGLYVVGGDVAADADAKFGVEAGFAHAAAALVLEDVDRALVVGPAEEDVGDELLEAGVFFHAAAGQVLDLVAFEEARQVAGDFGGEALEVAELVEEGGGDDEDAFGGDGAHGESFRVGARGGDRGARFK